jgi:hypothetical protein
LRQPGLITSAQGNRLTEQLTLYQLGSFLRRAPRRSVSLGANDLSTSAGASSAAKDISNQQQRQRSAD